MQKTKFAVVISEDAMVYEDLATLRELPPLDPFGNRRR